MKLSGKDIAKSGLSKFSKTVQCPWCESRTTLDLGVQHVAGSLSLHCRCGKFSSHRVADKWFDQHQERMEELKDVWKKIPMEAYLSCRQSTRGTPFVYTIYKGSGRPEEYMSRDIIEHILVEEWGMSGKQASGALISAGLTPGYRIYLQRHTRLVMAAEQRASMKRTGDKDALIATGTTVRHGGIEGLFLRYSANDGFAIVAFPAGNGQFGDAEVPVMELEVVDAGGPEVAEDFQFDKATDEDEGMAAHDPAEEEMELGGLEQALEHIEEAEDIVEDLVLEEADHHPDDEHTEEAEEFEEGEAGEEKEHEEDEEEVKDEHGKDGDKDDKPDFLATRKRAADPNKMKALQDIINDPHTDPQTLQKAQQQLQQVKRSGTRRRAATSYLTKDDFAAMERPEHKSLAPKVKEHKSDLFPKEQGHGYPKKPREDKKLDDARGGIGGKTAGKTAQRRVHVHYSHSGDLKRAIDVNRGELSIADIRDLCSFYANTGKIAHHEADDIARWFIGTKPRLLCASDDVPWDPEEWERILKKQKEKKSRRLCAADEAGSVEVPDKNPESGVGDGSGGTDNPDPKWQSGESANSISGPEKVKDHGAGDSPKDAGDVEVPDLGLPKGALSKRDLTAGGWRTCPMCSGSKKHDGAPCWRCGGYGEVAGARHKDGCGCGFCERMRTNQSSKTKEALSKNDMMKRAHDEVGIFMPALHNGTQVLVIAVDNTSLRATVQDGAGNQKQVNFADLSPTKTGPYSGRPRKADPGAEK